VLRVYRYRLYPTGRQREALEAQLRAACDLYNAALEQRRDAYRRCGKSVGYHQQSAELRTLRSAGLLSAKANFWSQQATLRQLDRAFAAFFRRLRRGESPGYPRFQSHRRFDTLTWTVKGNAGGVALTGEGRLRLQGIGCVKVKWHRAIPADATLGEVKVTRRPGGRHGARYYVAFYAERPKPERQPATGEAVGVDLGVRHLVTLSTGERLQGPGAGRTASPALRRAARRLARRRRGSHRRAKALAQLARQREREANRRRDAAHKLARAIADRFQLIGVEALRIPNMVRSARGTRLAPGTNVAAKSAVNRAIADQSWGQLLTLIAYKAEEAGGRVLRVDPANTSRTCTACGAVDARSRKGSRFDCVSCGHRADADVNAAKVILSRALEQEGIEWPGWGRQAETAALAAVA
jgi:putative transposase